MLKIEAKNNDLDDYIDVLKDLSSPCLQGIVSDESSSVGCSKVGGFPHVNQDFRWPKYKGVPLAFVAQLNLSELAESNLPCRGLLLFFYATDVWPTVREHKDCIRVIHITDIESLEPQEPEFEYKKRFFGLLKPEKLPQVYDEYVMKFTKSDSLPDIENAHILPALSVFGNDDGLSEAYGNLTWRLSEQAVLQIGGYPTPIQYDGLAAGAASIMNKGAASDWELLLEVNSTLDFMWGDAGRLYFFVHKDDLNAEKFTDVWMEFQGH